jgi:Domain of unknown function (DUF4350)
MPHRVEIALVVLLTAAITLALLVGRRGAAAEEWEPASSYRTGPMGARGPYEVLARLGVPEQRRRSPLFDLARAGGRPAVLLVISPERWLVSAEREAVAHYVDSGGVVIAGGEAGGLTRCFGWRVALPDSADRMGADSAPVLAPSGFTGLPPATVVLRRFVVDSVELQTKRAVERRRPVVPLVRSDESCRSVVAVRADTVLATTHGTPVIVRLRFRRGGQVLIVGDDAYLRNAAWRTSRVPEFLIPLIVPRTRGRLTWDEYHHGYALGGSLSQAVLGWMVHSPVGWLLLQLVAVCLVWLAVRAIRFGPAIPVLDRRRRSPLEHVDALAAGLEGARGVDTAVALTVSGLRRRLSRAGQPPRGDMRQWLAALEPALPGVRGRRAARRLQQTLANPGGPERVLAAAQAVEDVWQELRPRAMPAES